LNPDDTVGHAQVCSIDHKLLEENLDWTSKYDLVIGSNLSNDQALRVSHKCRENNSCVPFVLLRQYG